VGLRYQVILAYPNHSFGILELAIKPHSHYLISSALGKLMVETEQTSIFQKAIETVESLPLDDQVILLDLLNKRLHQRQRKQLLHEIEEVRQDYVSGDIHYGSVADFLAELDR
jgi:WD40 repeat protein